MWYDKLKELGVNIHVIATGAGSGIQNELWEIPGSSAYLSGSTFPYSAEEQEEVLGFMPEQFCSEEAAIDLASAAYMKAYKFGGKNPVGVGLAASVASEKEHRGDHRVHACIITNDKVLSIHKTLRKGCGFPQRKLDGHISNDTAFFMILDALEISAPGIHFAVEYKDNTELAKSRFLLRPFFSSNGKRHFTLLKNKNYALMSGAYNPPHEGHFGMAQSALDTANLQTVFEITATPPHKDALTVQDLLKRAKLLNGYDRLFTTSIPMYLDKAKAYPGVPLILGADAMFRMLDPKWGVSVFDLLDQFNKQKTKLYIAERLVDGRPENLRTILEEVIPSYTTDATKIDLAYKLLKSLPGRWDISSTELRNKK